MELPLHFLITVVIKPPILPTCEEKAITAAKDTMSMFLRDIYSVDTMFEFKCSVEPSKTRYYGLWGHRSVLSQYLGFDDHLKKETMANNGSNIAPLTVSMTRVSFAAFAALLKFVYTGELERFSLPSHFAISEPRWTTKFPVGRDKDLHRWHLLHVG